MGGIKNGNKPRSHKTDLNDVKTTWDNDNVPASLIKGIKSNLSLGDDGRVRYKIGDDFLFDALFGKVIHSYSLDHDTLYHEFTKAITETFKKKGLSNSDDVLRAFNAGCEEILRIKKKYILVTSISLKNIYLPKRRKIKNCTVSFSKKVPAKYRKTRQRLLLRHPELKLSEQEDFLFVSISVQAPNVRTAFMDAMWALDIIRAVWQIGFRKNINFLAMKKEHEYPTDSIISIGQGHTLHLENGKEAGNGLWYEPRYIKVKATTLKSFELAESNLDVQLSRIKRSPFQEHLNTSLASYIGALDHNDQEFRFVKLWSALEIIVKADNLKELKKRASFIFEDRAATKETLESLRRARNINAHSGVKPFNVEMKNFQMCMYLDNLLLFFINSRFKYKSLQQLIDFISSRTDLQTIEEQIANLNMVKKFIAVKKF